MRGKYAFGFGPAWGRGFASFGCEPPRPPRMRRAFCHGPAGSIAHERDAMAPMCKRRAIPRVKCKEDKENAAR